MVMIHNASEKVMVIDECMLCISWFDTKYLNQLVDLYKECFPNENWSNNDFVSFVNNKERNNVIKVLTDDHDKVYGTIMYTLSTFECCIRRVAVFESYHRQGLASYLINSLVGKRSPIKRKVFSARVRIENNAGIELFRKLGFNQNTSNVDEYFFTYLKLPKTKI